jgi:hypothetical protein
MKSTSNPKEQTMKTALTSSYVRLTALVAVSAPLAIMMGWGSIK